MQEILLDDLDRNAFSTVYRAFWAGAFLCSRIGLRPPPALLTFQRFLADTPFEHLCIQAGSEPLRPRAA
jgi:hypothetical protein